MSPPRRAPVPPLLRPVTERVLGRVVPARRSEAAWAETVELATWGRLRAPLGICVGEGILEVADPVAARTWAQEALRHESAVSLAVERLAVAASEVLRSADIDHRVLKGVALAHLAYPDPSLRSTSDLDLLVRRADHARALAALTDAFGATRRDRHPSAQFDRSFNHAATLVTSESLEIDLHRNLVKGPFGQWAEPDDLFERGRTLRLGGTSVPALAAEEALVHACYTLLLADPEIGPRALLDVALLGGDGSLDWDRVWGLAAGWRGTSIVAGGLALAVRWIGISVPDPPARAGRVERLAFDLDALPSRTPIVRHALTIATHGSWRGRVRYASGVLRHDAGGSLWQRTARARESARVQGLGRRSRIARVAGPEG